MNSWTAVDASGETSCLSRLLLSDPAPEAAVMLRNACMYITSSSVIVACRLADMRIRRFWPPQKCAPSSSSQHTSRHATPFVTHIAVYHRIMNQYSRSFGILKRVTDCVTD